jgi:hypothetical protein
MDFQSYVKRAALSGGLNLGAQLAQEGSEGDFSVIIRIGWINRCINYTRFFRILGSKSYWNSSR